MINRKDALLKLFIDIGGQGDKELIKSKISDYWEISPDLREPEKGFGIKLYHRLASVLQTLKDNDGYLENPERGIWKITDAGKKYIIKRLELNSQEVLLKTNGDDLTKMKTSTIVEINNLTFSGIKEEDFYAPFADWIVNSLEECTKAIPLGGKKFQDKWGTPDVIGIRELDRGAYIQVPTEIISAEIKTSTYDLIQAFGQANAYKLFSHKSYIVIPNTSLKEDIGRLDALSRICGIGLILFDSKSVQDPKFEIRARATRNEPDMFYIDRHLKLIAKDLFKR